MARVINPTTKTRPALEVTALRLARMMESGARQFTRAFQNDDGLIVFREASGVVTALVFPSATGTTTGLLMPNPIPFRGISIETLPAGVFNLPYWALTRYDFTGSSSSGLTSTVIQTLSTTATLFSGLGNILYSISGTSRSVRVSKFSVEGDIHPIAYTVSKSFSNFYAHGDHVFMNGSSSSGIPEGGTYYERSNLSVTPETSIPAYQTALAAASSSGSVKRSFVRASDGAVLASIPHPPANLLNPSLSANWFVAPQTGFAVGVEQSTWTGDGYLDIYNYTALGAGHMVATHSFSVPEDCIYPLTKNAPPLYIGDAGSWEARWAGGYRAGQRHRIAWLKKSSDQTIDQLRNGTLPAGWATAIKRGLPASEHVRRDAPLSATFSDDIVDNFTPPGGPLPPGFRNRIITRTVTMSYEAPAGLNDEPPREWVFTGTRTDTITDTTKLVWNVTTEFSDWWDAKDLGGNMSAPGIANLEPLPFADTQIVGDDPDKAAQFTIWNGTQRYTRMVNANGGVDSVYATNSSVLNPNGSLAFRQVAGVTPVDAANNVVGTLPEFINQYRTEYPLVYDANVEAQEFVDSRISDKNIVSFTPVGLITDEFGTDQKLGFLYHADDAQKAWGLEIWGTAYFTYSATDGSLAFKSWAPVQPDDADADSIIVDIPPAYDGGGAQTAPNIPEYNCIVRVDDVPWKDLVTAEKAARNERAAGRGDRIMKVVLDTLQTR